MTPPPSRARSHGTGAFERTDLAHCPASVVFEPGVLVFHPERVYLDEDVYVGHGAMLKGYYKNELRIGRGSWIGQRAFLHAAGGLHIGCDVGIGPGVHILTSAHDLDALPSSEAPPTPILSRPLTFAPVVLEDGCDLGVLAVVLPGVRIGRCAQIGAGAVVTKDIPPYAVAAGNPARVLRSFAT